MWVETHGKKLVNLNLATVVLHIGVYEECQRYMSELKQKLGVVEATQS